MSGLDEASTAIYAARLNGLASRSRFWLNLPDRIDFAPSQTSEGIRMKTRIRWMLIGLGVTFGLQVIISLFYTGLAFSAARSGTALPQGTVALIVLGVTLGAFLIGGFVVGWAEESLRVGDAVAVALLTLGLNAIVYVALPEANKAQFVSGVWLTNPSGHIAATGPTLLFVALALTGAIAGSYWGWRTAVPSEGVVTNVALLIGLLGAVVGPFILLAIGGGAAGNTRLAPLLLFPPPLWVLVFFGFWVFLV